jgi:hypothetical protein
MALVLHRTLAMPLSAAALFAIALNAPPHLMPPGTVSFGIAVLTLTMIAMAQWRRAARQPVDLLPATAWATKAARS